MITKRSFGKTNKGESVTLYTIDNGQAKASIMDFGANLVFFEVKDKNGEFVDIVLGYDDASGYDNDRGTYFGATVGRFANRIKDGKFTLNGKEYILPINNNGKHCLHGGIDGFSFKMYDITLGEDSVSAHILSPDGDEGFPGNLDFTVKYTLVGAELSIEYFAKSDADTVIGFTNHSYFNLNGSSSGTTILNHTLTVDADGYCEVDSDAMVTGNIFPVKDTPYDFRKPKLLSEVLGDETGPLGVTGGGIDNNMVLSADGRELSYAATLYNSDNGISLDCLTDLPGVQIYTGTFLNTTGKKGTPHKKFAAICLETQGCPNSPNVRYFPSPILKVGESFYSKTVYIASIK
ncbi:MAG: galactose mutarotase [Clostridia bacterium]|nr:galactose mutarotase [Clostridia bacterium]